jgi:hypothetical protein
LHGEDDGTRHTLTPAQQRNDMLKDSAHESANSKARDDRSNLPADQRRNADDKPTECGLTREELRALVIDMIG